MAKRNLPCVSYKISCYILILILIIMIQSWPDCVKSRAHNMQSTLIESKQQNVMTTVDSIKKYPLTKKNGACLKGEPQVSKAWLQSEFQAFADVYRHRLGVNGGGTRLSHQFALWSVIKMLKPKHIIESGIWNGLGTWILRQAAPEAQLILLDPSSRKLIYRDSHNDTLYFTGEKFKDFANMSWDSLSLNKNETLIFFDDHQSGVKRTLQAWRAGFRHIMFDDNFENVGDNFSLKKACLLKLGKLEWEKVTYNDNFGRIRRPMNNEDKAHTDLVFDKAVDSYVELPVVWSDKKRRSCFIC